MNCQVFSCNSGLTTIMEMRETQVVFGVFLAFYSTASQHRTCDTLKTAILNEWQTSRIIYASCRNGLSVPQEIMASR